VTALSEWDFLGPSVIAVSPFPPANDGIGTYCQQLVEALEGGGRTVRRIGLPGGGGDVVERLAGRFRPLKLLRHAGRNDDLLVMYHPHYFVKGHWRERMFTYASLLVLTRRRQTTLVVHEVDDPVPQDFGPFGSRAVALEEALRRRLWARRVRLVFHTDWERSEFAARFPARGREERLVNHGAFFSTSVSASKAEAREQLGLAPDRTALLCIGYLSPEKPDKAYDVAMRAVGEAAVEGLDLHMVGSPIARPVPEVDEYVAMLRALAAERENVHMHERFVSDEEFDLWIRAADALVLPYRAATSSGVAARARLLGTPMIGRAVGGIADQLGPGDVSFDTDEELVEAIREFRTRA
jgi:glycosyltransferase involved in cell wall biosynthesis